MFKRLLVMFAQQRWFRKEGKEEVVCAACSSLCIFFGTDKENLSNNQSLLLVGLQSILIMLLDNSAVLLRRK